MASGENLLVEWWWKYGRPAELWITYRDRIERAVEQWGLRPLDQKGLIAPIGATYGEMEGDAPEALWPRPFPGGLRFAHLHLGNEIYPLEQEQWREFSQAVVEDFQAKLGAAGTVGFRQVLEMGEVMGELG